LEGNIWDTQWDLDLEKLKRYFELNLVYKKTENRVSSYIMNSFR